MRRMYPIVWQLGSPHGNGVKSASASNSGACSTHARTASDTPMVLTMPRVFVPAPVPAPGNTGRVRLSTFATRPLVNIGCKLMPRTCGLTIAQRSVSPTPTIVRSSSTMASVVGTPSAPAASIAFSRIERKSVPRSSRWPASCTPSNCTYNSNLRCARRTSANISRNAASPATRTALVLTSTYPICGCETAQRKMRSNSG